MISGLVIHLSQDERLATAAVVAIDAEAAVLTGPRMEARLPAVIDVSGPSEAQELTDRLLRLPGVIHVDVTYVHLEEPSDEIGKGETHEHA